MNLLNKAHSQDYFAPFNTYYNTVEFNASSANLYPIQDSTGRIFVGNLEGLLVKSGKRWAKININNNSLVYTLYVSEKNQIYFASNKSFGCLSVTDNGKLSSEIFISDTKSRITRIIGKNDSIIFMSKEEVYISYLDSTFQITSYLSPYQTLFKDDESIIIKPYNYNFRYLFDDKLKPVFDKNIESNYKISTPFYFNKLLYFFSFPEYELFQFSSRKKNIKKINLKNNLRNRLKNNFGFQALQIDSSLAISTRKNGLIFLTSDSSIYELNENNGLSSNVAFSIMRDGQNGVWTALQNGISRIEAFQNWSHWNKSNNIPDIINSVIKFNNTIYISTMNGVYYYENFRWIKVQGINGRFFGMSKKNSELFVSASEQGLYVINNNRSILLSSKIRAWAIDNVGTSIVVPSELDGIYFLEKKNGIALIDLFLKKNIGTPYSVKYINDSTAWLSIKWEGLYKINLKTDTATLEFYDEKNGIPKTSEIDILKLGSNETVFATSKGFYQLNPNPDKDSTDFFIPVPYLNIKKPILKAAVDSQQNIWYATTNSYNEQVIKKLKHLAPNKYEDDSQGLQRFPNQIVNHIYPDPDEVGVIWIAGTKGLYKYDENIDVDFTLPFKTIMNRVSTGDSIIFHGFYSVENETGAPSFVDYQPEAYIPTLSYSNNNIKFEFSSSAYTYEEKNTYSYYLKGVDESWSNWNRRTQKEYSNLAPGKYIFQLKSKNLYGTEGKPTSYTFIIEAPWYLTTWAKIFFIVAGLLGIWVIVMLYNYRLRKHRKHLKLLVADRTFEVLSQKKEIELQYKKLSEQTEELKLQSEQIELKNRELEESQEEVLQINDTLEELNKQLEKKVEKRTAKIKLTLEKLKQTNKELDTFIYKASHDLKGPLSRILGLASLAKIETPSVKNIQYLDMIEHTSKDMDLLLSKLTQVHEIFNQHPKIVPLLVEEIIEEIKLKLNYLYSSEESEFVFNSTVNEPIYADHQLLYTVLFNLIENSLIYKNPDTQEAHQIKVSISKEDGQINIKIKDNGIGIKSDLLDAIFDMFYRASDRSKGSGLGLYLVKIAVEKMKGSIQVESTYLKHTTFNIKLPG
jgi:signal transduction histidine kinase/ligand-binding sensor domain-containing protein